MTSGARPEGASTTNGRGAPFTIVITRPAGQSAPLVAQLEAAGLATLEFPLIDIAPVDDPAPLADALQHLDRYALVVFVSPNAVDQTFARHDAIWPHALPVGVVGPGSVAALARHGIEAPAYRVISPQGAAPVVDIDDAAPLDAPNAEPEAGRFDSEGLFVALDTALGVATLAGRRVLIVRGDGGREWLAERLREAGATVETVAAYRRLVPDASGRVWERVHTLLAGDPHAWLVTSSEGVRNLDELAREHLTADEQARLKRARLVAPHPRIAQTARALGFDSITVSGAGDERIVSALLSAVPPVHHPASDPAPTRMTENNATSNASPKPATAAHPPNPPFTPFEAQKPARQGGVGGPLLWLVVLVIACAVGAGGFVLNRKLDRVDAQLAQRQQANDAQTADLRAQTTQALATVRQSDVHISQLEGKLADAQNAQQALQRQYSDLASNRDEWTLAEVGQMLSAASQQLQLTGNTQLALFALQSADTRLAASDSPQSIAVRKAIAQDIDKLKAAPSTDLTGLAIKLDNAIDAVDALPLSGETPVDHPKPKAADWGDTAKIAAATGEPRWKVWWREVTQGIGQQLTSLVQVRRVDHADAMLVSPDQGYFVRENLKLRLLSARLALLSRNEDTLQSDLKQADGALSRYFDSTSKQTQTVQGLVHDVQTGSKAVELPTLENSLQAVNQYRGRG